jgi:hypothetical protein
MDTRVNKYCSAQIVSVNTKKHGISGILFSYISALFIGPYSI